MFMSKICPFCKKEIEPNDAVCPHCTRVLREKISINKTSYTQPVHHQDTASGKKNKSKNYFISFLKLQTKKLKNLFSRSKTYIVGYNNRDKYKLFILIVVALLFFIGLYVKNNKPIPPPISVITDNQLELNNIPEISQKNPKDYISLQNGTVFSKKSYYLNGLGELQIKNGTNLDAIVKLVNMTINKSILTVYIKANSTYTIKNVKDGNYKLFFNLGNDWNSQIKAFNINSSYKVFEDLFDFTTREYEEGDYIRTRYSKFEVTLNPVIGGQAKTDNVNAVEFANY